MAPRAAPAHPLLTLPNLLSTSRVALAFAFVALETVPIRLLLLVVASATDILDGWLARRTHEVTRFGALVDPVADRLFVLGVVIGYLAGGQLAPWHVAVIMFRDVMSVIGWFVARRVSWLRPITFKARWLGKVVTVVQLVTFVAVLLRPAAVDPLVLLVGMFGLAATVDYTLMLWRERVR